MINYILWFVVAGTIGWAASSLMGTRDLSFFSRRTRETTEGIRKQVTKPKAVQPTAETQVASAPPALPQPAAGNFCRQCSTANPADAQFCKKCGANLGLRSDLQSFEKLMFLLCCTKASKNEVFDAFTTTINYSKFSSCVTSEKSRDQARVV